MNSLRLDCDVLVVGGGPAGLAAGYCAAQNAQRVTVVDDNSSWGGQIWRGEMIKLETPEAPRWFRKVQGMQAEFVSGAKVFDCPEPGLLLAEALEGVFELRHKNLIITTGSRERFLPFPGWTLPNVMGAGGLQALVKSGLPIRGKRVVVAGSGPLLLAVAAFLREHGADICLIAEQAPFRQMLLFGLALFKHPGKFIQLTKLEKRLLGVRYLTSCWPTAAKGSEKLVSVSLRQGNKVWEVPCDYLACGYHLVPNVELARLLGCELQNGSVRVDEYQETSVSHVYCAGEASGIGGLELSLVEGQIAGHAATGQHGKAQKLFRARRKLGQFARSRDRAFALRQELKNLPQPDTLVCRCEDVTFERLQREMNWQAAKLQTRCGMGPCQGRVCGPAVEFLMDWKPESVRPPIFPVRLESLTRVPDDPGNQKKPTIEARL